VWGWTAREGDLEREGDERVEEGEEEVCCHSCDPAPDDELLEEFQTTATASFGKMWAVEVLSRAAQSSTIMSNIQAAPQVVNPAIGFLTFNLRPFYPPVAIPAIMIGLIYLIIISFFSFSFYLPIHMKFIQRQCPLHFY
jgi:hypothetical protein